MNPLATTGLLRPACQSLPRAVLDLDADRFRLLVIPPRGSGGAPSEHCVLVRLGDRIAACGLLDDTDWSTSLRAVAALVTEARRLGGDPLVVAARPSFAAALNADGFLQAVRALHGVQIRILSADDESHLARVGVCEALLQSATVLGPRVSAIPAGPVSLRF